MSRNLFVQANVSSFRLQNRDGALRLSEDNNTSGKNEPCES
jgi:hypothetical protein